MADQNNIGRPLKFGSVEELQQMIDAYFRECDSRTRPYVTKSGELIDIPDPKPYTVTGLALALDTTRRTLLDYEKRNDDFSHTIRRAKTKIEAFAEESLWTPKIASGVIFNLTNNFGWVNKQEIEGGMPVKIVDDIDD